MALASRWCWLYVKLARKLYTTVHTSPRQDHASGKNSELYNPQTDPIPMRQTADPEVISNTTSNSYAPHGFPAHQWDVPSQQRQPFDHWKDDPVRFSVLTRPSSNGGQPTPTPKSFVNYVLASSTSSYVHSIVPSSFTLSSNTTDNSRPQSLLLSCAEIPCVYRLSQNFTFSSLYNQLLIEWLIPSLLYNVFLFCSLLFYRI